MTEPSRPAPPVRDREQAIEKVAAILRANNVIPQKPIAVHWQALVAERIVDALLGQPDPEVGSVKRVRFGDFDGPWVAAEDYDALVGRLREAEDCLADVRLTLQRAIGGNGIEDNRALARRASDEIRRLQRGWQRAEDRPQAVARAAYKLVEALEADRAPRRRQSAGASAKRVRAAEERLRAVLLSESDG